MARASIICGRRNSMCPHEVHQLWTREYNESGFSLTPASMAVSICCRIARCHKRETGRSQTQQAYNGSMVCEGHGGHPQGDTSAFPSEMATHAVPVLPASGISLVPRPSCCPTGGCTLTPRCGVTGAIMAFIRRWDGFFKRKWNVLQEDNPNVAWRMQQGGQCSSLDAHGCCKELGQHHPTNPPSHVTLYRDFITF